MIYTTKDFFNYTLLPHVLHSVDRVGMWECVELYPVTTSGRRASRALENFVMPGENVKHVLKGSMNDEWHDYYAIGTFDPSTMTWTPDDETADLGIGQRFDWGKFYASRTFYDPVKQRRIQWGYVGETDSQSADVLKGWASFQVIKKARNMASQPASQPWHIRSLVVLIVYMAQGIPRTVLFDVKTGRNLLTWPVEEVESLRMKMQEFSDIIVDKGSTVELDIVDANQVNYSSSHRITRSNQTLSLLL